MYYFLYSSSLHNDRKKAELRTGRIYNPGSVNVKGSWKNYTELLKDPNGSRYADSKVVHQVELLSDCSYKPSVSRVGFR